MAFHLLTYLWEGRFQELVYWIRRFDALFHFFSQRELNWR